MPNCLGHWAQNKCVCAQNDLKCVQRLLTETQEQCQQISNTLFIWFINLLMPVSQMQKEETLHMEAYEKMLETWMELITTKKDNVPLDLLKTHAVGVFDSYVHCHISPPDGCRMQVSCLSMCMCVCLCVRLSFCLCVHLSVCAIC